MIPLLIDTDPGVDDALALILALRSQEARVVGVGTVAGNVDLDTATENALRVLRLLGRTDLAVARGCAAPLVEPFHGARHVHGQDGLGDSGLAPSELQPRAEHAVDQIVRLAREWEGHLVLVALGPLTNLAMALLKDPSLPGRVQRVVVMGGAFNVPGNVTVAAEFNLWADPEAAARVFSAGWPLTLVGLNVTRRTLLRQEDLAGLGHAPLAEFVRAVVGAPMRQAAARGLGAVFALHDPLAVAIALDPSLATEATEVPVAVELRGEWTRGASLADLRARPATHPLETPAARVCLGVDAPRFLERFLRAVT